MADWKLGNAASKLATKVSQVDENHIEIENNPQNKLIIKNTHFEIAISSSGILPPKFAHFHNRIQTT